MLVEERAARAAEVIRVAATVVLVDLLAMFTLAILPMVATKQLVGMENPSMGHGQGLADSPETIGT